MGARRALALVVALAGCGGGGPWAGQSVPALRNLAAVWAFAPDNVWAGGASLLHYDGKAWALAAGWPALTGVNDLWGFSPTDLWAVGSNKVFHWNGATWTEVVIPPAMATQDDLNAVWGLSDSDLWVAGGINSEALHLSGTTWTRTITELVEVKDLWGAAPNDVWAAGQLGLAHWNGSTWATVQSDAVTDATGLWGFGASDVWVVGNFGTLAHWDGHTWTASPHDEDVPGDFQAVWGAATNDVWAVGEDGLVAHWNGTKWSSSTSNLRTWLGAISGSSADDVWAVGNDLSAAKGLVLHYQP